VVGEGLRFYTPEEEGWYDNEMMGSASQGGCRYVRMSLIQRHWPSLVSAFNAKGQDKLAQAAQKNQKR